MYGPISFGISPKFYKPHIVEILKLGHLKVLGGRLWNFTSGALVSAIGYYPPSWLGVTVYSCTIALLLSWIRCCTLNPTIAALTDAKGLVARKIISWITVLTSSTETGYSSSTQNLLRTSSVSCLGKSWLNEFITAIADFFDESRSSHFGDEQSKEKGIE